MNHELVYSGCRGFAQVEILSEGEAVNELHIVVEGAVEIRGSSRYDAGYCDANASLDFDQGESPSLTSVDFDPNTCATVDFGNVRKMVGEGDVFGEIAFFTEIPQQEV